MDDAAAMSPLSMAGSFRHDDATLADSAEASHYAYFDAATYAIVLPTGLLIALPACRLLPLISSLLDFRFSAYRCCRAAVCQVLTFVV